jgi:CheY-like chemotaxis protein
MPIGGTIAISARQADDRVLIDVTDTGVGMTAEVRQRIFEPFFTTKGETGTGLGLSMVFGIVQRHGGQIDVDSEPGRGTTVHLSFPAAPEDADRVSTGRAERLAQTLRILVVDDEPRLAMLAAGMVRRDGHDVTTTGSGEEALAHLAAEPFDLVLTDLSMGDGMNGWDLATAIGRIRPGLPVVLATGWGAGIDEADARMRGIYAVLAKPYRMADIRAVLAQVTRRADEFKAAE